MSNQSNAITECFAPYKNAAAQSFWILTEHMRGRGGTRGESIDRYQITKCYRRLIVSRKKLPKKFIFFSHQLIY